MNQTSPMGKGFLHIGFVLIILVASLSGTRAFGANLRLPIEGRVTIEFIGFDARDLNTLFVVSSVVSIAANSCAVDSGFEQVPGVPIVTGRVSS